MAIATLESIDMEFFNILMFLVYIGYPLFVIIDLAKKHKQQEKILKRFWIELGIGVLLFLAMPVLFLFFARLS